MHGARGDYEDVATWHANGASPHAIAYDEYATKRADAKYCSPECKTERDIAEQARKRREKRAAERGVDVKPI